MVLDERRLGAILAETQIVIETLGKAMLEITVDEEADESPALPLNDPRFGTLEQRYHVDAGAVARPARVAAGRVQFPGSKLQPHALRCLGRHERLVLRAFQRRNRDREWR